MKTPFQDTLDLTHQTISTGLIILAYCSLINTHLDKPIKGEATFTQVQLVGRMRNLGITLEHKDLVTGGYLNQEKLLNEQLSSFEILPQTGFYDTVNSHLVITFRQTK